MTTLKQIQKLIDSLESPADVRQVDAILKARFNTIQCLAGMQFRRGQVVMIATRSRGSIEGMVEKINAKSIDVTTPLGKYRVSPSLVTAA